MAWYGAWVCEAHKDTVVVYGGEECPLCKTLDDLEELEARVEILDLELDRLREECAASQKMISLLQEEANEPPSPGTD